ncbi:ABC transporter permease subunit [Mycoplasma sp. AC1221]
MEKLKLYNWYGESFDSILPQSAGNLKSYKKQIKNVFLRTQDRINNQQKIDKDLFLRARTKLQDNLKRELNSHKVAYKNKIIVLKDSIKKLSFCTSSISLLNFELKKINAQLKDIKSYAKDFVYSLTKSADDLEIKVESIKKLQTSTRLSEMQTFKKYTIFSILKLYLKHVKDTEFDIEKIHNLLLPNELAYIQKLGDSAKIFFKNFYESLEKQRLSLFARRQELKHQYESTYTLQKELYTKEKENIILENRQKILQIEYEYTSKLQERKSQAKQQKLLSLEKIKQQQEQILSTEVANKAIVKEIVDKSNLEVIKIKQWYRSIKPFFKERARLQNYKDLYSLLSKNFNNLPKIDFSIKNLDLKGLKVKNNKILNILNAYQVTNDYPFVNIALKEYLNFINVLRVQNEFSILLKSQYKNLLADAKVKYTYEGEFHKVESKALREKFIDYRLTRIKYCEERIKSKVSLYNLKHLSNQSQNGSESTNLMAVIDNLIQKLNNKDVNPNINKQEKPITEYQAEKQVFASSKKLYKKTYKENIAALKAKIKTKEITKVAFKNKKIEYKIDYKEAVTEAKLKSKVLSNKEILKTSFWREFAEMRVNSKIYDSKINEAQKSIPIETMKNFRWLALVLGFIFPGLSELLFFKQYIKGILLSLGSIFLWALIVPFSFGAYWDKMGGIPGFSDLGAGKFNHAEGILTDARIYLFGGVISVILMVIVIIYFATSSLSSYRVAKNLEYGSRPSKWSHTKRWISTGGYPWVISILGWVLMLFVVATPIITSVLVSFTNYGFEHYAPAQTVNWVGLKNWGYWWVFRNTGIFSGLGRVFYWTAIWTVFSTFIPISLGIIIAILTNNQRIKFKKIFRLIYILPWAIPAFVTLSFLRSSFQGGEVGYINKIMLSIGLLKEPRNWLGEIGTARVLVIVVQTWIAYAFIFMLVTGNLQSIPKDIYEAGAVDGAKGRQLFWHLTLPSLLISIAPMLIGQFVGAFNNFTTISIFTGGGPNFAKASAFNEASTDIIISFVFKIAQGATNIPGDQAFAAALTTFAALISIAIGARGFIKTMSRRD